MGTASDSRVALITGASSGIGRDTALALANAGWKVAAAARREARLQALVDQISDSGSQALAVSLDLADSQSISESVISVERHYHHIDAVIHCAGVAKPAPISHSSDELLQQTFATNLIGPTQLSREVIQHWQRKQKYGDFLFVSSEQVRNELPHLVHYGASKKALEFIARGIQKELRNQGCRCIVMQVGATETEFSSHFEMESAIAMIKAWEEVGIPIPLGHRLESSAVASMIAAVLNMPRHSVIDRLDILPTGIMS